MTVLSRLELWQESGAISPAQFGALSAIVRKDRFSVFLELNALLYLGVLSFAGGLAWTAGTYFERLGDATILISLIVVCGVCFFYCFHRAPPFSAGSVESPSLALDYVLYLAALVFAVGLGYIEFRFELLQEDWDRYLLLSAVFYLILAYRFDNRFVLSLSLSTLAGWFGLTFSRLGLSPDSDYRIPALLYGTLVAAAGAALWTVGLKPHFLRTYLHVAANVLFIALVSGATSSQGYLSALLALAAVSIFGGVRFGELAFAAYGTVYGYAGITSVVLRNAESTTFVLGYLVTSGLLALFFLVWLSGRVRKRA